MGTHSKEVEALLYLLDDPDEKIYEQIKDQLLSYGDEVAQVLESELELTDDNLKSRRIEHLLEQLHFTKVKSEFTNWLENSSDHLLQGVYVVCRHHFPNLSYNRLEQAIQQLKREVWLTYDAASSSHSIAYGFVRTLFHDHSFQPLKKINIQPQFFYLNYVLSAKKGDFFSIALLYLLIAESLNLPIYGCYAGTNTFILAFASQYIDTSQSMRNYKGDVDFFIRPFEYGQIYTSANLKAALQKEHHRLSEDLGSLMSNCEVIKAWLQRLEEFFIHNGNAEKAGQISQMIQLTLQKIEADRY